MGCINVFKLWILMVVLSLIVLGNWEMKTVSAKKTSSSECKEEQRLGANACQSAMLNNGKKPSEACCERVRASHVECICPAITPKIAAMIDVNRVLRLVKSCGRKVPRHFKCGSIKY
ncbi:AAI domain-containing protein [Heracleum sosnowskyi]|uniref:AAI domain-containing protein n=1 Tax=Heracleum sosnowskyi TaxID=360622 RepID=A0AAD8GYR5_9APIA|nr:AAI domain-containing protein [Heracleum sosnowskyi]